MCEIPERVCRRKTLGRIRQRENSLINSRDVRVDHGNVLTERDAGNCVRRISPDARKLHQIRDHGGDIPSMVLLKCPCAGDESSGAFSMKPERIKERCEVTLPRACKRGCRWVSCEQLQRYRFYELRLGLRQQDLGYENAIRIEMRFAPEEAPTGHVKLNRPGFSGGRFT